MIGDFFKAVECICIFLLFLLAMFGGTSGQKLVSYLLYSFHETQIENHRIIGA